MGVELARLQSLPEGLFARCKRDPGGVIALQRQGDVFQPVTAAVFAERVRLRARGLLRLGVRSGERVVLMAPNSLDWAIMDFAILSIGAITVPLYPTFSPREIHYVLGDSGAGLILLESAREWRHIQSWGVPSDRILLRDANAAQEVGLGHWGALKGEDASLRDVELEERLTALQRQQTATIVYTSGTTGWPKGVMLSHGNILSNIEGFVPLVPLHAGQRLLSILPLSHIFERGTGHFGAYLLGLEVAYAERPDTVLRDMETAHPDIVVAVPRVFQLLYSRVRRNIEDRPGLLGRFLRRGAGLDPQGRPAARWQRSLTRRLLIRNLRKKLGGRLRFFVSGGAPLDAEIARFFIELGLPVIEGYGMTEASPVIAANPLEAIRPGTVGRFLPNLEGRIAADGEILVRGPSIMQGYWNNESATRETLVDGWLHTGDVGSLDPDGYLHISDRKKDLIVNSAGENIPPQKIEMRLMAQALIDQAVVFGDRMPYLVALIFPNRELLKERVGAHADEAATRKAIHAAIATALADLPSHEQVRRFALLSEALSEANGELTPTLKVKRRVVAEHYAELLAQMGNGKG
ncbi:MULTISPECIES: AMP-dependent synthetase/ligase [Acidithiobacillus]|uniref:AMP-binding protein n=2 Tax=Acidithiobacillus TaxID=119977 RepID=A0A179BM86_ACIFR|nr:MULTISPECIES: AMP-dependent synthetase/ligase [Acidithiobacillus]MEB8486743.1 AMP-dependent synthetase/ligase [Acidithiobacillus ferriphilus]MEB8489098.1 AMP-dependent synthetase/ligase [Acidithiobacillus ferriphilus]MEB8494498.1 AMP-dependent synthetase/ligase [Acidithiobacillus ferriphilus]MEB8515037.1 AMP-dependent synthetase/ligase [Acidithiobacillus ferriphilus]MEB8522066.1 AMP-dependent synthetase/ligase [Acidithiobacillus ferriphilus]